MPKVINLRDTKGKVPEGAVRVDRRTKWGNPFKVEHYSRERAITAYRYLVERPAADGFGKFVRNGAGWNWYVRFQTKTGTAERVEDIAKRELRGKDLACWCAPQACHADVLLEIANA